VQVSVENKGALGRRMSVAVSAEQFEQAIASRLKKVSQQVKIPGFRPGKIPLKVVEARFGGKVMEEVAGELIQSTFREAIHREGLNPVAGPVIERKPVQRGKEFAYVAEFEIYPKIAKLDLTGQAIERPRCSITSEDVDRSIEALRKQRIAWQPDQREARDGDRVTVDLVGTVDGQAFDGGSANAMQLVLGAGGFMPGFEQGLIGAQKGDTRSLDLQFPLEHSKPELAGKPVKFEVRILEVAEPSLPEVDEDFVRQHGIEDGSVDVLRARVRANLEREMDQRLRALMRARVLEALVDANEFELPQALLKAEIDYVSRLYHTLRDSKGQTGTETADESAAYEQAARRRVARNLALAQAIQAHHIKADADKVRARVTEMAQGYESPEEFIRACYATPARLAEIEAAVVEVEAIEHLLGTAKFSDKSMTFQELIKLSADSN